MYLIAFFQRFRLEDAVDRRISSVESGRSVFISIRESAVGSGGESGGWESLSPPGCAPSSRGEEGWSPFRKPVPFGAPVPTGRD